ncbi:MAG: AAA family ATPase [Asgard group archaeon]|nr:AAA family ATPase [Asgard group archaeon]
MPGKIIFLNGASSSGKSTLAKLLHARLKEPYVLLSVDTFIESMIFPEGITDDVWTEIWPPLFHVAGFHAAILAMWKYGLNMIIDHVLQENNWFEELRELVEHEKTVFVGIYCNLEELEKREKSRNDREIGIAKYQHERVHENKSYTVTVDTSKSNPQECVDKIISTIESQ